MTDKIELDAAGIEAAAQALHRQQEIEYDYARERETFVSQASEIITAYLSASKAVPVPVETITELQNALVAEIELARTRPRGDLVAGLEAMGRTAVRRGEAGSVQIIANAIVAIADASPPKTYENGPKVKGGSK